MVGSGVAMEEETQETRSISRLFRAITSHKPRQSESLSLSSAPFLSHPRHLFPYFTPSTGAVRKWRESKGCGL